MGFNFAYKVYCWKLNLLDYIVKGLLNPMGSILSMKKKFFLI